MPIYRQVADMKTGEITLREVVDSPGGLTRSTRVYRELRYSDNRHHWVASEAGPAVCLHCNEVMGGNREPDSDSFLAMGRMNWCPGARFVRVQAFRK